MWKIFQELPSTFSVIQKNTKFSSRTVAKRLQDLIDLGFAKKDCNLYLKIPVTEWLFPEKVRELKDFDIALDGKFFTLAVHKIEWKMKRKSRGKKEESIKKALG